MSTYQARHAALEVEASRQRRLLVRGGLATAAATAIGGLGLITPAVAAPATVKQGSRGSAVRDLQTKLLRVIQQRELRRIGGSNPIKLDIRIIASTNKDLLTHILREEWGYDGMVTTDWWTAAEHHREVMAGNDLRMPSGYMPHLHQAMAQGLITRAALETAARHILTMILRID